MKKIKVYLTFLAVFALLLTSCSKDDEAVNGDDKLATLSFTTVLNNLVANKASLKQQLDIPACSDGAPAFVAVVLTGQTNVGTVEDPVIVSVNPDPDNFDGDPEEEYFTEESSELELVPGEYTLEYFVVYNGDPSEDGTEVIWVAPREDGELANFVDTALPFTFDLGPGAKKYVDVEVLCFDDRMVNEYGYLFFDLETTQAIEFCVFGNFCDENGRHFPAAFSVSIWEYSEGTRGDIIHSDVENSITTNNDGDLSASPLCLALPDTSGEDQYWVEITLLDSEAYDTEESVIRSGILTDAEVRALFDGEDDVDYYHFREGNCDSEDVPQLFADGVPDEEDTDGDEIPNEEDNCPDTENTAQTDSDGDGIGDACDACPNENPTTDTDEDGCEDEVSAPDSDGDEVPDEEDNCPDAENPDQTDSDGDGIGDACDACPNENPTTDTDEDGCEDEVSAPDSDGDEVPDEEDNCPHTENPDQTDSDGDGIGDGCDACPNENPTTDTDEDGCEDEVSAPDSDGDEVPDEEDNCPDTENPDQTDSDGDGIGDACDACPNENPTTDADADGCEDETACAIAAPSGDCELAFFESETGFVQVQSGEFPFGLFLEGGTEIAAIGVNITGEGELIITGNTGIEYLLSAYEIEVADNPSGEGSITRCLTFSSPEGAFTEDFGDIDASFDNLYVRIKANACPAN